jgi:hypothetical protein
MKCQEAWIISATTRGQLAKEDFDTHDELRTRRYFIRRHSFSFRNHDTELWSKFIEAVDIGVYGMHQIAPGFLAW